MHILYFRSFGQVCFTSKAAHGKNFQFPLTRFILDLHSTDSLTHSDE